MFEGSTNFFPARISEHSDGGLSDALVYICGSTDNGGPSKHSFITRFPVASIVASYSESPVLQTINCNRL